MDVDVHVGWQQRKRDDGDGEPVARQQRAKRVEDRLEEHGVAHRAAVDDDHDLIARAPRQRRR